MPESSQNTLKEGDKLEKDELYAQKPHSLADFIADSLTHPIFPKGLPEGMDPKKAAEMLGVMTDVPLHPLCPPESNWFCGWFPKSVRREDNDEELFQITACCGGFGLELMPAALRLLEA